MENFEQKDFYTKLSQLHNNGVLFIEPNKFNEYNLQNNGNDVDVPVNLEDLCIYCNLVVEDVSRTNPSVGYYVCEIIKSKNGEIKTEVNYCENSSAIMEGSIYGNSIKKQFTTDYTNMSYKEVENNRKNNECIGINSISISYDSWMCPVVDIEFTDVRGISLFSPNEFGHRLVNTSNGATGINEDDLVNSFFSAFFKFPYPKYKFYVKGFYGEPVGFDLALNSANYTFDSNTGNFLIKTNFIGYKFGVLNDITMTSLAATVASKEGDAYWNSQVENGRFKYGDNDLIRLPEIAEKYQKYKVAVDDALEELNNQLNDEDKEVNFYKQIVSGLDAYKQALVTYSENVTTSIKEHYKNLWTNSLSSRNIHNTSLLRCFGYVDNTIKTTDSKYQKFIQNREKIISYQHKLLDDNITSKYIDANENIFSFKIPDNSLWGVVNDNNSCVLKQSFVKATNYNYVNNSFLGTIYNSKFQFLFSDYNNHPNNFKSKDINLSLAGVTFKYCGQFKNNRLTYLSSEYFPNVSDNIQTMSIKDSTGKEYKTNLYDYGKSTLNVENNLFTEVKNAYNNILTIIDDLLTNNATVKDDEEKKKLVEQIKEDFQKECNIEDKLPSKIYRSVEVPVYIDPESCGLPKDKVFSCSSDGKSLYANSFSHLYLSQYQVNFTKIQEGIDKLAENGMDIDTELENRTQIVKTSLTNEYLNFDNSIRYVMKSLWAHVETFLHLCYETNERITASTRTAEIMHLTTENSHLPKKLYEGGNVGAFPIVTKREKIKETSQEKLVEDYLGNVSPESEEVKLVDCLLYGASHYYEITHSTGNNNSNSENEYINSTDDIRLAVYQYLRQFFDKWVHSIKTQKVDNENTNTDPVTLLWGVDTYFETHFLFIDTFYNKIGSDIFLNIENFSKACEGIFLHKKNTLMSFITTQMQQVNCILHPVQNFMINTINNASNVVKYYETIFSPVPLSKMREAIAESYFVMIYRGKPSTLLDNPYDSENENDGFMVYDDNQLEVPIGLNQKTLFDENGILQGYPIPAIGVTYGRQNQNYFIDVKVDTTKPMNNEVALAAQYEITGANINGGTGSNENVYGFGQDLYTIYANNSYTCTVTMMGCMWIQPLMYFQLNNVPMFRGTYMIQKVNHSISQGNMTTTFTGVRMSRYSTPFVKGGCYGLSSSEMETYNRKREQMASYDNNCPYHKFDPYESDECIGTENFPQTWLDAKFGTNYPSVGKGINEWYNAVKNKPTKLALASIIIGEDTASEIAVKIHATVIFNQLLLLDKGQNWRKSKKFNEKLNNDNVWCSLRWNGIGDTSSDSNVNVKKNHQKVMDFINNPTKQGNIDVIKCVEEIFTQSPAILINKVAIPNNKNYKESNKIKKVGNHTLTHTDLSTVYFTLGNYLNSYDWGHWYDNPNLVQKENNFLFQQDYTRYFSYINKGVKMLPLWDVKPKDTSNSKEKTFGDKLLDCIVKTFEYNNVTDSPDNIKAVNFDPKIITKTHNVSNKTFTFNVIDKKNYLWTSARITDILLNCYHDNIKKITCSWDSKETITKDICPSNIVCEYSETKQPITKIVFVHNNSNIVIKEGQFPNDMLKVLKKKYNDLNSKKASAYILNEFA